jgi:flagellar hook-associated protein 1 FlgK
MTGIGSFGGLNIALRGLLAEQRALDVTGHNIANVETEGYSRQEAIFETAHPLNISSGALSNGYGAQLGQGVEVSAYRRMRDDFLDLQWRAQNMTGGEAQTTATRLGPVQDSLGETSANGIGAQLSKFWSAWSDLASNPESSSAKTAVGNAAKTLATAFNALDATLAGVQAQATQGVGDLLGPQGPIQPMATELGKLNLQINQAIQAGQQPNDLQDRRDLLLDKLARYGQVSVTQDTTYPAMRNVSFAGATTPLVAQGTVTAPTASDISPSPGGQLGGLLKTASVVGGYRTTLGGLADGLATAVNTAHGSAIFTGAGAGGVTVNLPATINAGTSTAPGDNAVALAIAGLRGGVTDQGWAAFVAGVGSDVANAEGTQTTSDRVLDSLSAQRSSVSGVSLDEEMANMLRFQRGYQAAARALTAMDDNLDRLINNTGRVGM